MSTTYNVGVRIDGNANGLARAAQDANRMLSQMGRNSVADLKKMANAREILGIRSEREVQREILRTQAAYSRLARSGQLSWGEQRRAADATRKSIEKLNNELGKLSTRQKAMRIAQGGAVVGAGVGVGAAMLAPKVSTVMSYDMRLAHLSNTANSGLDLSGRRSGMRDIDRAVVEAVQAGGGTRDGALDTYEQLAGSGRFKPNEIRQIMKDAVVAATANGADAQSFAQMAISANATFGIGAGGMNRLFGIGTYAGQSGGFEIKDMAKWLPQQMAAAKSVGMSGETGFAKLAALNQAAINTAGTKDEAGNNVVNLLGKMGSQDTLKDFQKLGIDLPRRFAEGRMNGVDAMDVIGNVLAEQLSKDQNYQTIQRKLVTSKGGAEYQSALQSAGDIAQGTVVGKVFQDRQALMALVAYLNDRGRVGQIAGGATANADAHLKNMALVSETASYKTGQLVQQKDIAMHEALNKVTPAIGSLADSVTGLMREYPGYTAAIVGATTGLTALATAAGAAGLVGALTGGATGLGGSGGARLFAASRVLGGIGLAGSAGYGVGTLISKGIEGTDASNLIGRGIAKTLAFFGNKDARSAVEAEGHLAQALKRAEFKGEVNVRLLTAPGVGADADVMFTNPRIPVRADVGRTNTAVGY